MLPPEIENEMRSVLSKCHQIIKNNKEQELHLEKQMTNYWLLLFKVDHEKATWLLRQYHTVKESLLKDRATTEDIISKLLTRLPPVAAA